MAFVLDTTNAIGEEVDSPQVAIHSEPEQEQEERHVVPFDTDDQGEEVSGEITEASDDAKEQDQMESSTDSPDLPRQKQSGQDDRFFAHLDLLGRISECERQRQEAFAIWEKAKRETKVAKSDYEEMNTELQGLAAEVADLMNGGISSSGEAKNAEPLDQEAVVASQGDWRSMATVELLKGTKGIGAKKLESIAAKSPTVGDLEDLRGEASRAYQPFFKMLPDGCGQKMADIIEEKLIDHIAKFPEPDSGPECDPVTEEQVKSWVDQYRDESEEKNWSKAFCDKDGVDESPLTIQGFNAGKEGLFWDNCPQNIGEGGARRWIVGWVCSERLEMLKEIDGNADESAQSSDSL